MKLSAFAATVSAVLLGSQVWAQSGSNIADLVERDAIAYTNTKQIGRVIPFLSLSSYQFDSNGNDSKVKPTQRFGIGALTALYSGDFVFETGLAYMPIGTRYEVRESSGMRRTAMVDLDYVAVPLIAKKFFRADNRGLYFKAALTPAYRFSARSEVDLEKSGLIEPKSLSTKSVAFEDNLKKTDLQGSLGIGSTFAAEYSSRIFLDLTWNRSLVPISKAGTVEIYNEGYLFTAGLTL